MVHANGKLPQKVSFVGDQISHMPPTSCLVQILDTREMSVHYIPYTKALQSFSLVTSTEYPQVYLAHQMALPFLCASNLY